MVPALLCAVVSSPWLCGGHLMVPAMLCAVVSSPWLWWLPDGAANVVCCGL